MTDKNKQGSLQENALIITVVLPDDTPGVGRVTVKHGGLGVFSQFQYQQPGDIWAAVEQEAGRLIHVQENPPADLPEQKKPLETVGKKEEVKE